MISGKFVVCSIFECLTTPVTLPLVVIVVAGAVVRIMENLEVDEIRVTVSVH